MMNKFNQFAQVFKQYKNHIIASSLLITPLNLTYDIQTIEQWQNLPSIQEEFVKETIAQNNEKQQNDRSNSTPQTQERSSILESIWKLLKTKQEQEPALSSRGNICEVSPGLLGEVNVIYNDRPLFLWQGKADNLEINLYTPFNLEEEQKILWSQRVNSKTQYISYTGNPLEMGQIYDWETIVNGSSSRKIPFQIMEQSQREQISLELVQLETKLIDSGVQKDEIILAKANYFAKRDLWSDAIQTLLSIQNSNDSLNEEIEQMTDFICGL